MLYPCSNFLPVGAEIEVYNLTHLITKRFIPIDNESFLDQLDDATWAEDIFTVIENFLASYSGSKKPSLTTYELGKAFHEFRRSDNRFKTLRRLQSFVSDRHNLESMIADEFSHFDRIEARKIVGLN